MPVSLLHDLENIEDAAAFQLFSLSMRKEVFHTTNCIIGLFREVYFDTLYS